MLRTIIILALFFQLFFIISLVKDKKLNNIFKVSLICYIIFWIFAPGITAVILDFFNQNENSERIIHDKFCLYYILEFLILYFSVIFLKVKSNSSNNNFNLEISNKNVYYTIIILFTIILFEFFTLPKLSYIENNTLDSNTSSLFSPIVSILKSICFSLIILISCISNNKKIFYLSFSTVLITVAFMMSSGARISIAAIFFIIIYRLFFITRSKLKVVVNLFITIFLIIAVVLPILISIERARSSELNLIEIGKNIETNNMVAVSSSIFQKFNSIDAGIKLVDNYGAGTAGMYPYLGSLLIIIPKYFYPNKPISGSINNTYFGTPARLVPLIDNPNDLTSNVGVSPLAISIWQFGWFLGPLLLLLFTFLNIFFLNNLLNSESLAMNLIAAYLLPLPGFIGVFSSPDLYLKNLVYFFVFYLIIKLYKISKHRVYIKKDTISSHEF